MLPSEPPRQAMAEDVENVLLLHPHIFGIVTEKLDAHPLVLLP